MDILTYNGPCCRTVDVAGQVDDYGDVYSSLYIDSQAEIAGFTENGTTVEAVVTKEGKESHMLCRVA